jgi:hypothetical protein
MFYVINNEIDENNRFYPNYYVDDSDKNNLKYFDIFLANIDEKDLYKYGINKKISLEGAGKIIKGGSDKDVKDITIIEREQATRWKFLSDILRKISFQTFDDKSHDGYITNRDKLISILKQDDFYIKANNKYYTFNKLSNYCIQAIADEILCDSSKKKRKALYNELHTVNCLNLFCMRPADWDKDINQRQECSACTNYRNTPSKERPKGWLFFFNDVDVNGNIVVEITSTYKYIKVAYTNLCYNNYNKSYWGKTKVKVNGDTINNKHIFTYIPKSSKEEVDRGIKHNPEPVLIDNKLYECELMRPWYSYGKGIVEIDHKDGDHHNNTLPNIMPLCKICHGIKTDKQQDKAGGEGENFKLIERYKELFKTDASKNAFLKILNDDVIKNINEICYRLENDIFIPNGDAINKIWGGPKINIVRFSKSKLNDQELKDQLKIEKDINMQLELKQDIAKSAENAAIVKGLNDQVSPVDIGKDLELSDSPDVTINDIEEDEGIKNIKSNKDKKIEYEKKKAENAVVIKKNNIIERSKKADRDILESSKTKRQEILERWRKELKIDKDTPDPTPKQKNKDILINEILNELYKEIPLPYPNLI